MRASSMRSIAVVGFSVIVTLGCSSSSGGGSANDVVGSAECNAYCDKENALGCGITCRPESVCKIREGSCAAATRALLDCKVKKGSWSCLKDSSVPGVIVSYSCPDFSSLCGGGTDGGTDGATDSGTSDAATDARAD